MTHFSGGWEEREGDYLYKTYGTIAHISDHARARVHLRGTYITYRQEGNAFFETAHVPLRVSDIYPRNLTVFRHTGVPYTYAYTRGFGQSHATIHVSRSQEDQLFNPREKSPLFFKYFSICPIFPI